MKKKGLIISTIVMVVVLIAALTTSTYAWFNTSSVTKIDAFDVSVATNNAVKIGVKANNTYNSGATQNDFVTGSVVYTDATPGVIGGGTWTGDPGLSASLDHNIAWGEQGKAVGFAASSLADLSDVDAADLSALGASTKAYIYAANEDTADADKLANVTQAIANTDGAVSPEVPKSDYVHLFLGVAPTRNLTSSELIILIDPTGSSVTLGILSAIHVAYRLNSDGNWNDVDVYGNAYIADATATNASGHYKLNGSEYQELDGTGATPATTYHKAKYNDLKSDVTTNLETGENSEAATYQATYGSAAPTTGAFAVKITGLQNTKDALDQVEILIYIDGSDADCNQLSINNISGHISIFFHTVG